MLKLIKALFFQCGFMNVGNLEVKYAYIFRTIRPIEMRFKANLWEIERAFW